MRIAELPLEPLADRWAFDDEVLEDEDRIHELVKMANEKTRAANDRPYKGKPSWIGPSAELMVDDEGRCGHRPLRGGADNG